MTRAYRASRANPQKYFLRRKALACVSIISKSLQFSRSRSTYHPAPNISVSFSRPSSLRNAGLNWLVCCDAKSSAKVLSMRLALEIPERSAQESAAQLPQWSKHNKRAYVIRKSPTLLGAQKPTLSRGFRSRRAAVEARQSRYERSRAMSRFPDVENAIDARHEMPESLPTQPRGRRYASKFQAAEPNRM